MSKKLTTKEFIVNSEKIHQNYYNYSKSEYVDGKSKITIICPIHGEFQQVASAHLSGKGCNKCANNSRGPKCSTEDFVKKAIKVHLHTYDYDLVEYVNSRDHIIIICKSHGPFKQVPKDHLQGNGCPTCGFIKTTNSTRDTKTSFVLKAKNLHGDKYSYSKVNYINAHTKVQLQCSIHGIFEQTPNHHLNGTGCPSCAITGFDSNKPAILYYLSINNGQAYKIGITNRTVEKRFYDELDKIKVLKIWDYPIGIDAYKTEQFFLKKFSAYKYTGPDLLSSGNTELFNKDILELDI